MLHARHIHITIATDKFKGGLSSLEAAEIIKKGFELGIDYSLTSTCYDPSDQGNACGQCDACLLRLKGFSENGFLDPIKYQDRS